MREYRLPHHVFVCFLDERCIWLDTRADQFRGTSKSECKCLSGLVEGWPVEADASAINNTPEAREIAEGLLHQGLLTRDSKRGKTAALSALDSPIRSLNSELAELTRIRPQHWVRFLLACCLTVTTLKLVSLRFALSTVTKRKAARRKFSVSASRQKIHELVYVFMRLRSRFYTAKRNCLFDSLTLVHFLAAYKIYPILVIGVSESPFRAHSWVQQGDAVLNFEFEYVKEFCPVAVM